MESEVFTSLISIHTKIDNLTSQVTAQPCAVNNNRLNNVEKIVYGACKLILVAFVIGVITVVATSGNKKAVADQKAATIIKDKK